MTPDVCVCATKSQQMKSDGLVIWPKARGTPTAVPAPLTNKFLTSFDQILCSLDQTRGGLICRQLHLDIEVLVSV